MIPFPGWVASKLFAVALTGAVGMALGGYIAHRWDAGTIAEAKLETASVQASYDGYKATVAADAAKATALALSQQTALQGQIDALQGQLLTAQRTADAKSKALSAILAGAKPGDVRPIGVAASAYYDRLRGP